MPKTTIEIGSLWVRIPRFLSPWEAVPPPVKILEVKSNWVRYETASGLVTDKPIEAFLDIYEPESDWPGEIEV